MSNYQQHLENEDDSACRTLFAQQYVYALNSQQNEFRPAEMNDQNEQHPSIDCAQLVLRDQFSHPVPRYQYLDWNRYKFSERDTTELEPWFSSELTVEMDYQNEQYSNTSHSDLIPWDQPVTPAPYYQYQGLNQCSLPTYEATTLNPWYASQEELEKYALAWETYFGWNQEPAYIHPEEYDTKNLHRYDGNIFICDDPLITVPATTISAPTVATPVKPTPPAIPWTAMLRDTARQNCCSALGKYCRPHTLASSWKFYQRIPYHPRTDVNWREIEQDMTGVPVENIDDKWVNGQSH